VVDGWVAVAQQVGEEDGDEAVEQGRVDGRGLDAGEEEGDGEEADGYVQDFAGNFVFVDLLCMLVGV
jgi:hypothetical protein